MSYGYYGGFRPSHHSSGSLNCPLYFSYKEKSEMARNPTRARNWRNRANRELSKCHAAHGYGACGHCGTPAYGDHSYGGCGTFFGLTRDPLKRACFVERRLTKMEKKCAKGRRCGKADSLSAELSTLQLEAGAGPDTLRTALDISMEQLAARTAQDTGTYQTQKKKTQRTVAIAVVAGLGLLATVAVLTR